MKVSVEVKRGALTRQVSVTTHSIERAVQLAGGDLPGAEARVVFPIDQEESFFGSFDPDHPIPETVEPHDRLRETTDCTMWAAA